MTDQSAPLANGRGRDFMTRPDCRGRAVKYTHDAFCQCFQVVQVKSKGPIEQRQLSRGRRNLDLAVELSVDTKMEQPAAYALLNSHEAMITY